MPELSYFDDFASCFDLNSSYCLVYTYIKPTENSPVWEQIQNMNRNKYHYRHDKLKRGVCIKNCQLNNNSNSMDFHVDKPFPLRLKDNKYFNVSESQQQLVRSCTKFNSLETESEVHFCVTPASENLRKGK